MANVQSLPIQFMLDSGANCFVVNDPKLLHDVSLSSDQVMVTGGTSAPISHKVSLHLFFHNESN